MFSPPSSSKLSSFLSLSTVFGLAVYEEKMPHKAEKVADRTDANKVFIYHTKEAGGAADLTPFAKLWSGGDHNKTFDVDLCKKEITEDDRLEKKGDADDGEVQWDVAKFKLPDAATAATWGALFGVEDCDKVAETIGGKEEKEEETPSGGENPETSGGENTENPDTSTSTAKPDDSDDDEKDDEKSNARLGMTSGFALFFAVVV